MIIDQRIIERLRKQSFITEYQIIPFQSQEITNYSLKLTNVPVKHREDVTVIMNGKILDHWAEVTTTGTIWCRIPKMPNSAFKVYTLTGNPSAQNLSNGDNVFLFFDDFPGSTLNANKWTQMNSPSVAVSNSIMTITNTGSGGKWIYSSGRVLNGLNTQVEAWAKFANVTGQASIEFSSTSNSASPDPWQNSIGIWTNYGTEVHGGLSATGGTTIVYPANFATTTVNTYKRYMLRREGVNVASCYKDNESINLSGTGLITANAWIDFFGNNTAGANNIACDWVFMRKYFTDPVIKKIGTYNKTKSYEVIKRSV